MKLQKCSESMGEAQCWLLLWMHLQKLLVHGGAVREGAGRVDDLEPSAPYVHEGGHGELRGKNRKSQALIQNQKPTAHVLTRAPRVVPRPLLEASLGPRPLPDARTR